ncbi:uncharacterized protein LOC125947105 [Dermacentor silvarum]|uniref:uncharacterized protein LOC125947105 n=1 Tax=Dermacentor silvarum TaxID=543639 RepID=UPI002101620A|nr:uncharacterized protein LOC125947105 [Dermacentor silvarum]
MDVVADIVGAVRGRIFEVSFDEYIGTVNGLFNFLEIVGGMAVYFMVGTPQTRSQGCLRGTAYTFFFNGIFMIISSFLSATSAHYLPTIFYCVDGVVEGAPLPVSDDVPTYHSVASNIREFNMPSPMEPPQHQAEEGDHSALIDHSV